METKNPSTQLNQRIDSVENTLNKMMDGIQNDLSQKIDNLQYSISRFANLNTVQEKRNFPSQFHQNQGTPAGHESAETPIGHESLHLFTLVTSIEVGDSQLMKA